MKTRSLGACVISAALCALMGARLAFLINAPRTLSHTKSQIYFQRRPQLRPEMRISNGPAYKVTHTRPFLLSFLCAFTAVFLSHIPEPNENSYSKKKLKVGSIDPISFPIISHRRTGVDFTTGGDATAGITRDVSLVLLDFSFYLLRKLINHGTFPARAVVK